MITEKQIEIANVLLSTGLVDKVYHSCELVEDEKGAKFPAYKVGDEQYYVGPDDSKKMFAYIRANGQATTARIGMEGSCAKMYTVNAPHRIVIFQDHVKEDFDALVRQLLKVAFIQNISLISFNNNAFQLGKQESPIGKFAFDATTFYLAIDVQIKLQLRGSECDSDTCIVHPNPICL
jgi:hypothetical protein